MAQCGHARVEAPNEVMAHAWAKLFTEKGYAARAEEGTVDFRPSWLVIIEGDQVPEAAVG